MLKKRLGTEAIERSWNYDCVDDYFKIPSTLTILESCEKIGNYAFENCKSATIILEKPKKDFKFIGSEAFECCRNVKEKIRY